METEGSSSHHRQRVWLSWGPCSCRALVLGQQSSYWATACSSTQYRQKAVSIWQLQSSGGSERQTSNHSLVLLSPGSTMPSVLLPWQMETVHRAFCNPRDRPLAVALALPWHGRVCQETLRASHAKCTCCRPLAQAPRTVALMMQGKQPVPALQAEQALVAGAEQALTDASARAPAASQLLDGMKQSLPSISTPQDTIKQVCH